MARTPWEPTKEQHLTVAIMAACGMPHDEICKQIINSQTRAPITKKTLYDKFRAELDDGIAKANALVAQSLFKKATGTGPQSVTAAIFWLKTKARWKESQQVEISGPDGGPIQSVAVNTSDPIEAAKVYQQIMGGGK